MIEFVDIASCEGWYQQAGNDYDVALSSRIRLSRNLSNHRFPFIAKGEELEMIREEVLSAFESLDSGFEPVAIGAIKPTERRMLLERNFISQQFTMQTHKSLIMHQNQNFSSMINETDHLRPTWIQGGLCLKECWEHLDSVDSRLEKVLDYAVALEWGYLSSEVTNTGTGMRASAMLHLPALVISSRIEKAMKAVVQMGMTVKGFFSDGDDSLGNMYQISNQLGLGVSETEILEKLDAVVAQLVHYERNARDVLLSEQRVKMEDQIMRAYGILQYCRTISAQEAIENLLLIRLGAAISILDLRLDRLTAMLFLTQKAHIQHLLDSRETSADTSIIDMTRADLIRNALAQCV